MLIIAFFPVKSLIFYNELWLNGGIYQRCTCLCWIKGPAVQTSYSNTFYRPLPMIYNSNQQHTIMEVQGLWDQWWGGGGGLGTLTSRWQLKWMDSSSNRPNIDTILCVNGLFPLVQYRSWVSGSGQMLSNEDETILDCIIRLYFCPSSINLNTNMVSVSIGWSSRTNLHGKHILSVFM